MKNTVIYLIAFLGMIGMASCENWLDVSPKSEIKAEKLFETETGFKDALAGLYIGMTNEKAYGANLSWQALEFMAGQYQNASNSYIELQKYNYGHATSKKFIEDTWAKTYNIIAETNLLLESLEKNGSVLNPTVYNVVKGEALAIRAMCHFDLMRLYARGNIGGNPAALNSACIPYITSYSKVITQQRTYEETLALLHQDIEAALECLKSDPLYTGVIFRPDDYEDIIQDVLFTGTDDKGRETHLSYPAVLLLNARVYLWEGNQEEAGKSAGKVIDAYRQYVMQGKKAWATESGNVTKDEEFRDYVFRGELLFALDVQKLEDYTKDAYPEYKDGNQNNDRLFQARSFVEGIFYGTTAAVSDYRFLYHWESAERPSSAGPEKGYVTVKIRKTQGKRYVNYIPLMRVSEAYLIAAECLIKTDKNAAVGYLNNLKEKRNVNPDYYLRDNATEDELRQEITQEYRREFSQEGQLYFYYKRLGMKSFPGIQYNGDMTDQQYQLPYPDIESDLGQRQ